MIWGRFLINIIFLDTILSKEIKDIEAALGLTLHSLYKCFQPPNMIGIWDVCNIIVLMMVSLAL